MASHLGSPFRRGPGILRRPEDPLTLAITHHTNKLKWHTFHCWQMFVIKSKLNRLQLNLTQFIYRRKLCQRTFAKWHQYVSQCIEVRRLCTEYKRTGSRSGGDHENIMNLIVAIYHRQQFLRQKYFSRWRLTILHK